MRTRSVGAPATATRGGLGRRVILVSQALMAVAVLSACNGQPQRAGLGSPPLATRSATVPNAAVAPSPAVLNPPTGGSGQPQAQPEAHADGHTDEDGEFASPPALPVADAASDAAAVVAAEAAMRRFARRAVDAETWSRELLSLLTPAAQAAYSGTDPANVPASAVTGPGMLAASTSAFLARVSVPTDAGAYLVLLVRTGSAAPWLVERLTPPETAGS